MAKRQWRTAILWLIGIGGVVFLIGPSASFQECIRQRENTQPYHTPYEEGGIFVKPISQLRLNVACAFVASNENTGAITALAGVVVAIFTGTLWWVTWGMVNIAGKQRTEMMRSIIASEHAALAAKQAAELTLRLNEPQIILESLELHGLRPDPHGSLLPYEGRPVPVFRNYGTSPAFVVSSGIHCDVSAKKRPDKMFSGGRFPERCVRNWPVGTVIQPGKEFIAISNRDYLLIDKASRTGINTGDLTLFAYVFITTSDIFGRKCTDESMLIWLPFDFRSGGMRAGFSHCPDAQQRHIQDKHHETL